MNARDKFLVLSLYITDAPALGECSQIDVDKFESEPDRKKVKTVDSFMIKISLEEIVFKLAIIDGFSIRAITESDIFRNSISSRGFKFPKDESSVMNLIASFAEKIKNQFKEEIKIHIFEGQKFTITLEIDDI